MFTTKKRKLTDPKQLRTWSRPVGESWFSVFVVLLQRRGSRCRALRSKCYYFSFIVSIFKCQNKEICKKSLPFCFAVFIFWGNQRWRMDGRCL